MLRRLLLVWACGAALPLQAATGDKSFLSAALTKTEDVTRRNDVKGEDKVTIMNLSAAFGMGQGFMLGLKYFDYSQDGEFLEDANAVIQGYGPMVGYMHTSGFYANLAYLFQVTKTYKARSDKLTYEGGDGYVLDVGKVWELGSNFGLGLALTQSKVSYEKVKSSRVGSESLSGEWSDSSLYPYIALFLFL